MIPSSLTVAPLFDDMEPPSAIEMMSFGHEVESRRKMSNFHKAGFIDG